MKKNVFLCSALLIFLAGCSSFGVKTVERYEGEFFGKAALERKAAKDGTESMALSFGEFPTLELIFTVPDAAGYLSAARLEFLSTAVKTWNEFTLELHGGGALKQSGGGYSLALDALEEGAVTEGRIRNDGVRLSGEAALRVLGNRRERLAAMAEWMRAYRPEKSAYKDIDDFEDYWKPILLPEMVSKKKRPAAYSAEGAAWVRAEDVNWNASYTAAVFPEELGKMRDSGAFLRDWEEALPWLYFETVKPALFSGTVIYFQKVK